MVRTYVELAVAFAGDSAAVVQTRGSVRLFPLTGGEHAIATFAGDGSGDLAVSPDGQWVACTTPTDTTAADERYVVTIAPLAGGKPRTLPFGAECWAGMAWHPDAKQIAVIAYASCSDDTPQIHLLAINGDPPRRLAANDRFTDFDNWSFSPDGATLAIECEEGYSQTLMSADLTAVLAGAAR